MIPATRVMVLIDADNVSADVMEQALERVKAEHGAAHVRRAYCTAEAAVQHLKLFKTLSIRPIVNVSLGKNCTDIALAVDAIDLVLAERPDIVVIVSSDSDFAPLVIRLREKGCRVEGIGQEGKTGEASRTVYDAFLDLPARKPGRARRGTADDADAPAEAPPRTPVKATGRRGARRAGSGTAAEGSAMASAPAAPSAAAASAARAAPAAAAAASPRTSPPAAAAASPRTSSPAAAAPSPRTSPSRASARREEVAPAAAAPAPAPAKSRRGSTRRRAAAAAALPEDVQQILGAVPALREGAELPLNTVAEALREAGLVARNASSTKLLRKHAEYFLLAPERQPNRVRYRAPVEG